MIHFFHTDFLTLLFCLLVGHALGDFALQNDFLAQAKNRHTEIGKEWWRIGLFNHSMIHGGFVLLFTGSISLAVLEVIIHAATDYVKCEGWISADTDQFIHIVCKVIWAVLAMWLLYS